MKGRKLDTYFQGNRRRLDTAYIEREKIYTNSLKANSQNSGKRTTYQQKQFLSLTLLRYISYVLLHNKLP